MACFCLPKRATADSEEILVCKVLTAPRTACDESLPADVALEMLRAGNRRFLRDATSRTSVEQRSHLRASLSENGQNPAAVVIACSDSRCPVEILFDGQPGDLFVLRNAGNTCCHAEGSMVGSAEYATGHLNTNLILVLGHTKCGAIAGATAAMVSKRASDAPSRARGGRTSLLDTMLADLAPIAKAADAELPPGATTEEIAAHAVRVNVFHTMEKLLEYSAPIRRKVEQGKVQVHGAIYDLETGRVDFLGQSRAALEHAEASHPAFWGKEE